MLILPHLVDLKACFRSWNFVERNRRADPASTHRPIRSCSYLICFSWDLQSPNPVYTTYIGLKFVFFFLSVFPKPHPLAETGELFNLFSSRISIECRILVSHGLCDMEASELINHTEDEQ